MALAVLGVADAQCLLINRPSSSEQLLSFGQRVVLAVPIPASDLPHIFRVWPVLRAGVHFPVNPLGKGEAMLRELGYMDSIPIETHQQQIAVGWLLAQKLSVLQLARMVGHMDIRSLQTYYNETAESMARLL